MAQAAKAPAVSHVFARLQNSLETRSSALGDEVSLITLNDVISDNQVVIPKGSKIIGQVAGIAMKGKDEPKSVIAIRLDKAVSTTGREIPLQAIIAAIAAPQPDLPSDPTYAMLHSNEPKMVSSAQSTASSGNLSASSKANSNAAVATAEIKGRMNEPLLLNEDSQGAVGFEDVSVAWQLSIPPPLTIFSTKAKNLKLPTDTQMLVRMAAPRLAR
jgi:hypothetical protein